MEKVTFKDLEHELQNVDALNSKMAKVLVGNAKAFKDCADKINAMIEANREAIEKASQTIERCKLIREALENNHA